MKRFAVAIFVLVVAVSVGFVVISAPWQASDPAPIVASEEVSESLPADKKLEIRYIANEGVLLTARDKRVLIDGLHRRYEDDYAYLPDAEREKIEAARPPFESIDLVLVSHMHGDHFHPESVGLYLEKSPKTLLATSNQVVGEVASKFQGHEGIKSRVTPIDFVLKQQTSKKLAGIDVDFLGLGHGSGRHATIQNLGHVVNIGGMKVLHVGDTEVSPEIFDAFGLDEKGIDIAVLPFWFLTNKSGQTLVNEHIKPKHIIAVHVGPTDGERVRKQVKEFFPNADVFTTLLEKRQF